MKALSRRALIAVFLALTSASVFAAKQPTISNVTATNVLTDSATITWTTNLAADSQVEYGTSTRYGSSTTRDTALVTSHSVVITGLAPNTTYNYRVKSSSSPGGSQTVSSNFTFKTKQLPPLGYVIQFFDSPSYGETVPKRMNARGQIVGYYGDTTLDHRRAFFYDHAVHGNSAIDLELAIAGAGVPEGWTIWSATGINNEGIVVGYLRPVTAELQMLRRGFVVDMNAETPTLVPLPNFGNWDDYYAADINDNGDIFIVYYQNGVPYPCLYNPNDPATPLYANIPLGISIYAGHLNNPSGNRPAQISGNTTGGTGTSGLPFRWTPGIGVETFPNLQNPLTINGFNDAGTIAGAADSTTNGATTSYPIRLTTATPEFLKGAPRQVATDLNNSGDALLGNGVLYRDDWAAYGYYVDVNKLLLGTAADKATWTSTANIGWDLMNDRDAANNAGQIAGRWISPDRTIVRGFILTPIAP